jgi:hypothetical protein
MPARASNHYRGSMSFRGISELDRSSLKRLLLTALRLVALMITSASTKKIAPYEC